MDRVHSIELLLDDVTDAAVRESWAALAGAGLPSLAHHAGETNAPHVSLSVTEHLDDRADPRLRRISRALPLPLGLGGLVVFGRPPRGLVLARGVIPTAALLALHRDVHESAGGAATVAHTTPGRWTPHVTLASRLDPDQLARAIEVLAEADRAAASTRAPEPGGAAGPPESGRVVALRRWDSDARTVTIL
ncbi:hypothetical protein ASF89_11245 [Frigoribacterium sp. Leaf172]|nr:hypothetical protein ASF89_11245 [Frigoribacterium sp. Leaf172]